MSLSPRPPRDLPLLAMAAAALLIGFVLALESRRVGDLERRSRIAQNKHTELEQQLRNRTVQLDGALETITELKGGQPASRPEPEPEPAAD